MNLMNDVIEWAKKLPYWQQVIIKGILKNDTFEDSRINEIAELAIMSEKQKRDIRNKIGIVR
jgi:aromatic ring-opening dioxygenase LigB subunit